VSGNKIFLIFFSNMFFDFIWLIVAIPIIISAISCLIGVPFLPVHKKQARVMMDMAQIKLGEKMAELGSGAGRLFSLAAARGAKATGYELNPLLVFWTKLMIFLKRLNGRVDVKWQSIYAADLKDTDVVCLFLFPGAMAKLSVKLRQELKPGARILSYTFSLPGWDPIKKEQGIYLYKK